MATKIKPANLHSSIDTHIQSVVGISTNSLVFEGDSANDFETTISVTNPTADRTVTIPNASGTMITTGNLDDMTTQDYGLITGSITLTNDYGSVA